MSDDLSLLILTAASVGFIHTLVGPDHYLPFIALARTRGWSPARTARVTLLCGLGHVASSVLLGAVGIALGLTVSRLQGLDSRRADLAAWLLIAVGLVYLAWGLRRAVQRDITRRDIDRRQGTSGALGAALLTPWALFIAFLLGPCEPLIPVLMYPAATFDAAAVALVAGVFAAVTLATMLGVVLLGSAGVALLPLDGLERYGHAMAGGTIALCGIGIRFLGL